jgi:ClpA/ClpB-like protein
LTLARRQSSLDVVALTIDELAAIVEARAGESTPATRLGAAIELGRELSDLGDALIGRHVAAARAAGLSWTEIGRAFGTSKQAVQQRYGVATAEPGHWPGRWTPNMRQALEQAVEDARALGHDHLGTEHVLLALAGADGGIAGVALRDLGVARERILATSCMRPALGDSPPTRLALMPRLKQALEHSRQLADRLEATLADTEHVLAGIVAVPDSMAVEILRRLGVSSSDVTTALGERMGVAPALLGLPRRRRRRLRALSR